MKPLSSGKPGKTKLAEKGDDRHRAAAPGDRRRARRPGRGDDAAGALGAEVQAATTACAVTATGSSSPPASWPRSATRSASSPRSRSASRGRSSRCGRSTRAASPAPTSRTASRASSRSSRRGTRRAPRSSPRSAGLVDLEQTDRGVKVTIVPDEKGKDGEELDEVSYALPRRTRLLVDEGPARRAGRPAPRGLDRAGRAARAARATGKGSTPTELYLVSEVHKRLQAHRASRSTTSTSS